MINFVTSFQRYAKAYQRNTFVNQFAVKAKRHITGTELTIEKDMVNLHCVYKNWKYVNKHCPTQFRMANPHDVSNNVMVSM